MIVNLKKLKETEYYTKYKVADTEIILKAFEDYKKENNLTELTIDDKRQILANMGYTDEEIDKILQYV